MFIEQAQVVSHLRQLANKLDANFAEGSIKLLRHESQFEINLYPPACLYSKPSLRISARFEIKTAVTAYSNFMVRKNDLIDWITEHILLKHDFQTKDAIFDNSFFITVDDPGWASRYFTQSKTRLIISNIMSVGLHRVYCVGQEMKVDKFLKTFEDCPSSEEIVNIVDKLPPLISLQSS